MTLVALIGQDRNNNGYYIQQNDQNSLKGLIWGTAGATLTAGALATTVATVGLAGFSALAALGMQNNYDFRKNFGDEPAVALVLLSASALLVNYVAVKVTGSCLSNAIHHLGSPYEIVKK